MTTNQMGPVYAIVVAAGRSDRMGGQDKIFTELVGRPLLAWSLGAFQKCDSVASVVVVAAPTAVERVEALVRDWRFTKVATVVPGGDDRQASVRAGLEATADASFVVVHDAARPLVTVQLIERGIALARESGAAVCAVPAHDTVKEAEGDAPVVVATYERSRIWLAQTPQVFRRTLLMEAHARAVAIFTDDAALVEALGHRVVLYEGLQANLKITTPDDLVIAEALLRSRLNA